MAGTLVYYFLVPEYGIVGFPRSYRGPLSTRLDLLFPLQESRDGDWRHLFGIVLPLGSAQTSTSVETGDLLTVILRRSLSGMEKMGSLEFGRVLMNLGTAVLLTILQQGNAHKDI